MSCSRRCWCFSRGRRDRLNPTHFKNGWDSLIVAVRTISVHSRTALETYPRSFSSKHIFNRKDKSELHYPTWIMQFGSSLFGPSGATRTPGLLIPNNLKRFFLVIYGAFSCFLVGFRCSLDIYKSAFPRCSGAVCGH